MAKSARTCVFEGMERLPEALIPFVERRLNHGLKGHWQVRVFEENRAIQANSSGQVNWDQQALLNTMNRYWREAFDDALGREARSWVNELVVIRNKVAHNEPFTYDDAERSLDTMYRLMDAINEGEIAASLKAMRKTILQTKWREEQRNEERRKVQKTDIAVDVMPGLLPWREVVTPHDDVAKGSFQQSEFAADLATVSSHDTAPEYRDAKEFFSRTYLTTGLKRLLLGAAKRLSDKGGDPVVELQTNFGGGKTHSMLALYHMTGSILPQDLLGVDQLLGDENLTLPVGINRAILVGTAHSPGSCISVANGPEIHTLWGYMAWQLGGAEGYAMVAENDINGTAPGSNQLRDLFRHCAPCLILIDEWVAYLRQIYKVMGLPAGSFDSNLSFAQSLTEAVKTSPRTVLVASLPASQIEVGGTGGAEALDRLKQTFSRVQTSWQPANQEESYEIVRRRLFKQISADNQRYLDNTVKQFSKLYRENSEDFPVGWEGEEQRRKLSLAYPIHPKLFDQLYESWGSLEKFQRTRGVLRFMAQVVHEQWMQSDKSVMIMPGSVAVGSTRVEPELLHYLDQTWQSIIAGDVDGTQAIPYRIDKSLDNLGRYSAARRVARTIFMETAPLSQSQNNGIDVRSIHLGVVQPGEKVAIFSDALRRLASEARFLHSEGGRYWYSMSASLNREADDRAKHFEEATVLRNIDESLRKYTSSLDRGLFAGIHAAPSSSKEVPDECDGTRIVFLGAEYPSTGRWNERDETEIEVKDILVQRGNSPRVYRNTLVFLAPEKRALETVTVAMRQKMAWESIYDNRGENGLNLKESDIRFTITKLKQSEESLKSRLKECWCCLLFVRQEKPEMDPDWTCKKLAVADDVLNKVRKYLVGEEGLFTDIGPERFNRELKEYIWKEKTYLHTRDVWENFNRYLYLPRMQSLAVLQEVIKKAVSGLTAGPFAYAAYYDDHARHYNGLFVSGHMDAPIVIDKKSLLVRSDIAQEQQDDMLAASVASLPARDSGRGTSVFAPAQSSDVSPAPVVPTRFIGTVSLPAERPSKVFGKVVEGIIEQLKQIPGADIKLELDICANIPEGLEDDKIRTLIENAKTLNFSTKNIE
ncbi:DUF499 domain-containing protein [Saccharibacter floricola]|uniref:ATPase-like protein n=1 Tax=Saccharibacter floricola DSM 15669 TaxID=1123227 RepID=A0ABQ0P0Y7_9PROT|nr:DUF499 domain-containing protein [Saccharibacter floricola]GBQ08177.1 ATPase-like protein [Saccharibacter floricola DSM 15669]